MFVCYPLKVHKCCALRCGWRWRRHHGKESPTQDVVDINANLDLHICEYDIPMETISLTPNKITFVNFQTSLSLWLRMPNHVHCKAHWYRNKRRVRGVCQCTGWLVCSLLLNVARFSLFGASCCFIRNITTTIHLTQWNVWHEALGVWSWCSWMGACSKLLQRWWVFNELNNFHGDKCNKMVQRLQVSTYGTTSTNPHQKIQVEMA